MFDPYSMHEPTIFKENVSCCAGMPRLEITRKRTFDPTERLVPQSELDRGTEIWGFKFKWRFAEIVSEKLPFGPKMTYFL